MGKKLSASEFDRNFVLFCFEHLVGLFVYIHAVLLTSFVESCCSFLLIKVHRGWGLD